MSEQTVVEYAVARLAKLGISDVFGLPGDFAFPFDDALTTNNSIQWRGTANELNASYAADGYARIRGSSLLCTTYAVGELSALCGVMGGKAERSTIFHLVGMPSMRHQRNRKVLHHSFGDGVFQNYINISAQAACAHAILTPENCKHEMERVIAAAMANRQPGYFIVAQDLATMAVTGPDVEPNAAPESDPSELQAAVQAALSMIGKAKSGCVLPSFTVARFGLGAELEKLIEATGLPFATTTMDKTTISESHPQFIGMYAGTDYAAPNVVDAVEGSDVVINAGGVLFNDFSTAGFANHIDPSKMITIGIDSVRIGDEIYEHVQMRDMFTELASKVDKLTGLDITSPKAAEIVGGADDPITASSLYPRYERFFEPNDIAVVETGMSSIGCGGLLMPEGAVYHNQTLWGSIGWATGAALGAGLADTSRRLVLITGDGAHQLTANEIGSYARHGLKPIVFVVNNDGYAAERAIEDYPDWVYNDLAPWDYHKLPAAMGCKDWYVDKVATNGELDAAMDKAKSAGVGCYIEIKLGQHDYPPAGKVLNARNWELYAAKR